MLSVKGGDLGLGVYSKVESKLLIGNTTVRTILYIKHLNFNIQKRNKHNTENEKLNLCQFPM